MCERERATDLPREGGDDPVAGEEARQDERVAGAAEVPEPGGGVNLPCSARRARCNKTGLGPEVNMKLVSSSEGNGKPGFRFLE